MDLTPEELKELKELYKKELGLDVSDEEAIKHAEQFVNLLKVVYRPDDPTDRVV